MQRHYTVGYIEKMDTLATRESLYFRETSPIQENELYNRSAANTDKTFWNQEKIEETNDRDKIKYIAPTSGVVE